MLNHHNVKILSSHEIAEVIVSAIEDNNLSEVNHYLSYIDIDFKHGLFLNTACRLGHFNIAQYLIKYGANISIQHNMPLMYACMENHEDCFYLLLSHGANPLDRNFDIIYHLIRLGNYSLLQHIYNHYTFDLSEQQILFQLYELVENTVLKLNIQSLSIHSIPQSSIIEYSLSVFQTLSWYLLYKNVAIQEPLEELFWKHPKFTQLFLTYVLNEHEDKFLLLKSLCIAEEFQHIYKKIKLKYTLDKNLNTHNEKEKESDTQKI